MHTESSGGQALLLWAPLWAGGRLAIKVSASLGTLMQTGPHGESSWNLACQARGRELRVALKHLLHERTPLLSGGSTWGQVTLPSLGSRGSEWSETGSKPTPSTGAGLTLFSRWRLGHPQTPVKPPPDSEPGKEGASTGPVVHPGPWAELWSPGGQSGARVSDPGEGAFQPLRYDPPEALGGTAKPLAVA